ncbi:hypothetical protein CP10881SC42_0824 [Chlamydia avium]|uniref:Uncharacterized protein n=2 Tax=Chlamydia avium TaxID=1457141 RepID=A0ABN0MRI0_9CHLA|nr:hypothetical protein CP10881SC42_0824 [Chlamydia avium]
MDQRLTIQELRQVVSVLGDKLSIDHLTANIPPLSLYKNYHR